MWRPTDSASAPHAVSGTTAIQPSATQPTHLQRLSDEDWLLVVGPSKQLVGGRGGGADKAGSVVVQLINQGDEAPRLVTHLRSRGEQG